MYRILKKKKKPKNQNFLKNPQFSKFIGSTYPELIFCSQFGGLNEIGLNIMTPKW